MLLDWTATFPSTGKYSITYTATLTGPGPSVITNGPKAVTCDPADDVEDVAVNFDPGDLRPGVGSGRTATLTASAHVAAATANAITVSLSIDNGKASCSPSSLAIAAGQTQNTQSVTVTGNQKSDKDRDTHIIAQVGGNEKARSDITVTIPNRWTSSAISGAVSCKIPSLHPDSANNNLARARYTQTKTITVQDQFGKALSGVWSAAPAVTLEENGGGGWLGLQPDNNGNFPPTPVPSGGAVQDPLISDYPSVGWWTVGQVGDAISGSWTPPDGDPSSVDLTYEVNDGGTTFALQSTNHRVMTYIAGVRSWKDNKQ